MWFPRRFRWPLLVFLALSLGAFVLAASQSPPYPLNAPSLSVVPAPSALPPLSPHAEGGALVPGQPVACQHAGLAPDVVKHVSFHIIVALAAWSWLLTVAVWFFVWWRFRFSFVAAMWWLLSPFLVRFSWP